MVLPAVPSSHGPGSPERGMAAAAPDRDPVLAVLVQQVQDLFGGVSGELLDVPRGQLDVKVRGAPEPRGDAGRGGEAVGDAAGSGAAAGSGGGAAAR